jgi:glycosyltransferase involved in cell wall biosynthesis
MLNKYTPGTTGGVEAHVGTLSRHLGRESSVERLTVVGFAPPRPPAGPTWAGGGRVRVVALRQRGRLGPAPLGGGLRAALRGTEADLVHLHMPSGLPELAWALSGDRRPLVVTYHAAALPLRLLRPAYRRLQRRILRRARRILTTNPVTAERDPLLADLRDRVRVVPLGIDPEPFERTSERTLDALRLRRELAPDDGAVVLFVGRLVPYKGLDVLVEAARLVAGLDLPPVQWLLVGEGRLRDRLCRLAEILGVAGQVRFLGQLEGRRLVACYHAADLLVLPSISAAEGFGLVQVEAQLASMPVVSTDLPTGVPFVNRDGETGLVVTPGSAERLAAAVARLLADPELRMRLGQAGRRRALTHFTASRMTARILEVYREVLEEAGGGTGEPPSVRPGAAGPRPGSVPGVPWRAHRP